MLSVWTKLMLLPENPFFESESVFGLSSCTGAVDSPQKVSIFRFASSAVDRGRSTGWIVAPLLLSATLMPQLSRIPPRGGWFNLLLHVIAADSPRLLSGSKEAGPQKVEHEHGLRRGLDRLPLG
jgi:hypothetical protein